MRSLLAMVLSSSAVSASLVAITADTFQFNLGRLVATEENGLVSVNLEGSAPRHVAGAPDLPVIRREVLVPSGSTTVSVEVTDSEIETFPLSAWGSRITPSQGRQSLKSSNQTLVAADWKAYESIYPETGLGVVPATLHKWRDVQGTTVELNPISVDHTAGTVKILRKATIKVTTDSFQSATKIVDPDFMDVYSFVYANWDHFSDQFQAADKPGRVMVVYDSKFKEQADKYSALVKQRLGQQPLMYEADSSVGIQAQIRTHFEEEESLTYVTIIGRDVPTKRGSHTGGKECDHCYVMISGGVKLDLFIGRLSGASVTDIETQLTKIANYDEATTAAWTRQAFGTAFNLAGDEYRTMTTIMQNLGDLGFTKHDWVHGNAAYAQQVFARMNEGLGVFSYLGHGQGDAWDTPMMTESGIRSLQNQKMPFFEIDVSCDNGAFQTYNPCMGEALLTATGGAIASMMHAPEARGTMCKNYMVQATVALKEGKANRVGSVYTAALMAAQAQDPDDYAVEGYNVFGDPTLKLPFAASGLSIMV